MQGISDPLTENLFSVEQVTKIFVISSAQSRAIKDFKSNKLDNPYHCETLAHASYQAVGYALLLGEIK